MIFKLGQTQIKGQINRTNLTVILSAWMKLNNKIKAKTRFFFQKFPLKIDSERKKKKNSGTTE